MAEMLAPSAGNLFLAAIMPGVQLLGLYRAYIVLVATFQVWPPRDMPRFVIMGNTMPPRDPDEDDDDEEGRRRRGPRGEPPMLLGFDIA